MNWACCFTEQRGESKERPQPHRCDHSFKLAKHLETSQQIQKGSTRMPCRKENYIFLEQSVTVDSKEVDALVTKIGEALQLHNNSMLSVGEGGGTNGSAGAAAARQSCCMRLRSQRGQRGGSRASPYHIPAGAHSSSSEEWDHIKPWSKQRRSRVEEDDPHRLLQELIMSGNLIKEAVRRLQFSAPDCGDFPKATTDNVPC